MVFLFGHLEAAFIREKLRSGSGAFSYLMDSGFIFSS